MLQLLIHLEEANAGIALTVRPGDLAFGFERALRPWQLEDHANGPNRVQHVGSLYTDSALAEVRQRGFDMLLLSEIK